MKKRMLAVLLCLCLIFCLLPAAALAADGEEDPPPTLPEVLIVGSETITAAGHWTTDSNGVLTFVNTTTNPNAEWNIHYDGVNTLTLKGATIIGPRTGQTGPSGFVKQIEAAIYTSKNLTLVLEGENTVTAKHDNPSVGVFAEDCDLTITAGTNGGTLIASGTCSATLTGVGYGLNVWNGNITITDGASVEATGSGSISSFGISIDRVTEGVVVDPPSCSITINTTGTVEATGETAFTNMACGINAAGSITISKGTVIASGGEEATDPACAYGIRAEKSLTISGGAVTATGSLKVRDKEIRKVVVGGISAGETLTISGGTVTATGRKAADASGTATIVAHGIRVGKAQETEEEEPGTGEPGEPEEETATLTISGGTVTAQGLTAAMNIAPTFEEGAKPRYTASTDISGDTTVEYKEADIETYKYLKIDFPLYLATPTGLAWDSTTPGKATWSAVANAYGYSVQLYKDNTAQGSAVSVTSGRTHDFTDDITAAGVYTFSVIAKGNGEDYLDSESATSEAYIYCIITFGTQPQNMSLTVGGITSSHKLTAAASVAPSGSGTATLNWYECSSGGTISSSSLGTGGTFNIPTDLEVGTYHYLCQATATGAAAVNSNVATVTVKHVPNSIVITPTTPIVDNEIAVPYASRNADGVVTAGSTTHPFKAMVYDKDSAVMTNPVITWAITNPALPTGVTIDADTGILTVTSAATAQDYVITATASVADNGGSLTSDAADTYTVKLTKEDLKETFIKVIVDNSIVEIPDGSSSVPATATASAVVHDQYGDPIDDPAITWSNDSGTVFTGDLADPQGISIADNNKLTVTAAAQGVIVKGQEVTLTFTGDIGENASEKSAFVEVTIKRAASVATSVKIYYGNEVAANPTLIIDPSQNKDYTFTAKQHDQYDLLMDEALDSGVTWSDNLAESSKITHSNGVVTVPKDATATSFTLSIAATEGGNPKTDSITVNVARLSFLNTAATPNVAAKLADFLDDTPVTSVAYGATWGGIAALKENIPVKTLAGATEVTGTFSIVYPGPGTTAATVPGVGTHTYDIVFTGSGYNNYPVLPGSVTVDKANLDGKFTSLELEKPDDPKVDDTLGIRINYNDLISASDFTLQWYYDGGTNADTPIPGAIGENYEIKKGDRGKTIIIKALATDDGNFYGSEQAEGEAVVPATKPDKPSNVTATAGNGTVTVNWDIPDDETGGEDITSVDITLTPAGGGAAKTETISNTASGSHTFTGLANGVAYAVTMTATNRVGASELRELDAVTPRAPSSDDGDSGGKASTPAQHTIKKIESAEPGDTVKIDLPANGKLDGDILDAAAGRDVTLEIEVAPGLTWVINGQDIPENWDGRDLDLGLKSGGDLIPVTIINAISGEKTSMQLELSHEGPFGLTLTLRLDLGRASAGLWANLYRFHQGLLEFISSVRIGADGQAGLPFDSASSYVVIVDAVDHDNPFIDVNEADWFYDDVLTAYRMGLINGRTANTFVPEGSVTIAEAIKLAACMHQLYTSGSVTLTNGPGPEWYSTYVDYAIANGIIAAGQFDDYEAIATRADFAVILAAALPEAAYGQINDIQDEAVPDVNMSDSYGPAVYKLYRAGILKGNDALLTFAPGSDIKRSEVAAIVTRMMHPEKRVEI